MINNLLMKIFLNLILIFQQSGATDMQLFIYVAPVEGCYIILMYKKLEEFIFNNNNLGVTDNMNNQIVMDKIDDGTSHFTSKFYGSVQNANFVTYLGKGEESARGKLKDDSIEVASLCTSALCNKQEILLLKSSNSTNLFSQSESVTNIDVPILDITLLNEF